MNDQIIINSAVSTTESLESLKLVPIDEQLETHI